MGVDQRKKAILSGWVRLWMVFALLSWVVGGLDLAVSSAPLKWPLPVNETTPQSIRHLIWFLGPIVIATIWSAVRWVWLGFRPPAEQAAAPRMSTNDIARRTIVILLIAAIVLGALAIVAFLMSFPILLMIYEDPSSFGSELLFLLHIGWSYLVLRNAWELITDIVD